MPRTGIVVTARDGSSRLPGKHLRLLDGQRPLLEIMLSRLDQVDGIAEQIVATDWTSPGVTVLAQQLGWRVYTGHPTDILARLIGAATHHNLEIVVFVPGDQPLIDPAVVTSVLRDVVEKKCDFAANTNPDGFAVRVMETEVLLRLEAAMAATREHGTHLLLHPFQFCPRVRVANHSSHKFSVDTAEDLRTIERLVAARGTGASLEEYVAAMEVLANGATDHR